MTPTEELRREIELTNPNFKVAGMLTAEGLDALESRIAALESAGRHTIKEEACDARHAEDPEVRQAEEPPVRTRKRR